MKKIFTLNAPEPIGPYSQGIQVGNFLYLSGQLPLNPKTGKLVEGNIRKQTRQIFGNIKEILNAAGSGLSRVVKSTVFMLDLKEFSEMNEVYSEYFKNPFPARSTVQVANLPAKARIEIEVVAFMEAKKQKSVAIRQRLKKVRSEFDETVKRTRAQSG
jgi:2-iminobutanoate/2-iminopropanoate deaminase